MTEEELIKEYIENQKKKQVLERHAVSSKIIDDEHTDYLHSTHYTKPEYYEAQETNLDTFGTSDLEKARLEQAQRGETSFVGGTGDSMLVDNEGNYVSKPSPFDAANTNASYDYATDKEKMQEIIENKLPVGNAIVDYKLAQFAIDSDLAWSDYLESGTMAARTKAQEADKKLQEYQEKAGYMAGNIPYVSANAQYIPQGKYYLESNIPAGVAAGVVGVGTGIATKSPSKAAAAAKLTFDITSLGTSYEATRKMTQGSLFRELVDMGIPESTARYYAQDSAVQQAWVEIGSGAAQRGAEWLIAAVASGTLPGKIALTILGSRAFDVLSESAEEAIQEQQSMNAEKNALAEAGMDTSMYTKEYESQRRKEAALSAVPITLGVAGVTGSLSQAATTAIVDQKNIQSIKNSYNQSINSLEQKNAELQEQLNNEKLSGKEKYTINKQISDNNKQITALQEASSDENVKNEYQAYKEFQKALQESQELRDSTKFVETQYADGTNAAIERAQANARKSFGNNNIYIEAEPNITQVEKNLKDVIEKRTGKNVVYYTTFGVDNLGTIRGFVEDSNTIYIEAGRSAKDTIASAIHEYGHILANENPTLFEAFKNLAKNKFGEELDNKIVEANKQTGTFDLQDGQQLTDLQKNFILEEMFGDQLAEIASKKKNVKALENSTLSVFDKIKDAAKSIASEALGVEATNQRISGYDYSGISYANGDILQDESFEKQVMDTLKSLKNVEQTKETKTPKSDKEKTYARIEEQYKKMRGAKSPEAIKKMIADELGLQYNGPKDNSSDAREVRRIYQDLKDHSGTLFSKRGSTTKTELKVSQNLSSDIDQILQQKYDLEEPVKVKDYTPDVLVKYGDAKPYEMYTKATELRDNLISKARAKKMGIYREGGDYHNLGKQFYMEAIDNIDDPVAIIKSISPTDKKKTLVVITDLIKDGEQIIVPVRLDGDAMVNNVSVDTNRVKSVYGKFDIRNFVEQTLEEDLSNLVYLTKDKKRRGGIDSRRLQLSETINNASSVNSIVSSQEENVNNTKYSMRKGESKTERIVNNQRNEIERLNTENEELREENKGLKKITKGIKSTGREQIRNVQRESDKMLKVGRETELKLNKELDNAGKKYSNLSRAAMDLKYETQLDRKAQADGIKYDRGYKNLFVALRREGKSITEAYNFTKEIYEASKELNNSIDSSMKILNDIRKKKVYNKLPTELKKKIDSYEQIWAGSRKQTDLTLAKRILDSATAKEYLGKVALSKGVRNKIMNLEGDDFQGKGTISLEELFNGSVGLAKSFEQGLIELRQEIEDFQAINKTKEKTIELSDDIADMQVAVEDERKKQGKSKFKGIKKNALGTNKTLVNTLMTPKTEIQAMMGGNIHTPLMKLNDNLQHGEFRRKQSLTETYRILTDFMRKSRGINKALGTKTWDKKLEESLSNKSKFTDTGMSSTTDRGKQVDIKLPRHMMMSLAMHLTNDQNMMHISGGIVDIKTDDKGNTTITPATGMGVRIPDETLYRKGKFKDAYDAGVTVRLSRDQVETIVDMLTPEEKAFVEATKEVFKYTTSLINEVSNRIVGYDMATVENYFPLRVWSKDEKGGATIDSPFQSRYGDALNHMLTPGWLQERVTSTSPIYLENIAEALNRTVNNVTNFYGYAEALRDNHIILNSTMTNGESLATSLGELSSSFMPNYDRLTRFISGQERLTDGTFRSLMAMNTLTFNVGTWLKQPVSFFNTLKYFSTKEFMSSLINSNAKLNNMIRDYFNELGIDTNDYSNNELARAFIAMATPSLEYRAIGYKTPELNQLFNKTLQQKIGVHGIQAFDDIAVTAIARMMAYSVSLDENIEFGSEEYFNVLGDRLTQVLNETQPEYSQVNRANVFRSRNGILRMISLFGTPATQMFNNFTQSLLEVTYEAREGKVSNEAKTNLAKSISGVVLSGAMIGLINALRDFVRDDDDDEKLSDRFIAQSIIALLSPTLILDDIAQFIMSMAEFGGMNTYDFNTPETTFMNGLVNLAEKIWQLGDDEVSGTKKTKDLIKAIGVVTPIDTKGLVRFTEFLMKVFAPDLYSSYSLQTNSNAYKSWLKKSDTPMSEFYKAYTATRQKELEKLGYHKADKEKGIESNLKETRRKALEGVFSSEEDVDKYMEILFNYKS